MHEISHRIRRLTALLDHTRGSDRFILAKEVRRLKKRHQQDPRSASTEKALSRLEKRLQRSKEERQWRLDNLPAPTSLPRLPITTRRNEIILTVKNNPVVIISGETGSGKSTQIPKFCLMAGQGVDGKIGCTQPRRIAATTVAHRVARELGETLGRSVGYKIRFKDRCPERAFIKFMTDGILLAEMQGDRFLNEYDTLIVDEAHERSINIDFILGLLKRLIDRYA